jgi:Putative bacterial sensory transduction regulator
MTQNITTSNIIPPPVDGEFVGELIDIQHVDVIETVIGSLDPAKTAMVSHNESGYVWKFTYGSVEIFVQLTGKTDDDVLTIWSYIMNLPTQHQPDLLQKLLQMNWDSTLEARFAISDMQVVVMSTRTVADLSPGEISRAITLVANVADEHDDELKAAFPAL